MEFWNKKRTRLLVLSFGLALLSLSSCSKKKTVKTPEEKSSNLSQPKAKAPVNTYYSSKISFSKRLFSVSKNGKVTFKEASGIKFLSDTVVVITFPGNRSKKKTGQLSRADIAKSLKSSCKCSLVSLQWLNANNLKVTTKIKGGKKRLLQRLSKVGLYDRSGSAQCLVDDDCALYSLRGVCCSVCKDKIDLALPEVRAIPLKDITTVFRQCHRMRTGCFCDISEEVQKRNLRYRAICKKGRCTKSLK